MNPKEIIDLSQTLPFFAEHRLILLENTGFFKKSCDELAEYVPEIPETSINIDSVNDEWKHMTFMNFEDAYNIEIWQGSRICKTE